MKWKRSTDFRHDWIKWKWHNMWKYGARLDWTTVIVDTRDANAHSPMPCKFQWFDDCAIATMFFFFKNCFYFSCFIGSFLSWIFLVAITKTYSILTNHRCVSKIQWQRSWSVSHQLFHRRFFIHCHDVCMYRWQPYAVMMLRQSSTINGILHSV